MNRAREHGRRAGEFYRDLRVTPKENEETLKIFARGALHYESPDGFRGIFYRLFCG